MNEPLIFGLDPFFFSILLSSVISAIGFLWFFIDYIKGKKKVRCLVIYENGDIDRKYVKIDGDQALITKEWHPKFHKNRQIYLKDGIRRQRRRYNVFIDGQHEDIAFNTLKIIHKKEGLDFINMVRLAKAEVLKWLGKKRMEKADYITLITLIISVTSLVFTLLICWKLGLFNQPMPAK